MSWLNTGLTLIDSNIDTINTSSFRTSKARMGKNVTVNNDKQTVHGSYLDFTGPAYLALNPGQLGVFTLNADVVRTQKNLSGDTVPLKICSVNLVEFTHKDASKQALIDADKGTPNGLQISKLGPVITNSEQSASLNVIWQVDKKYVHDSGLPYYATFEVTLDQKNDGCIDSWTNRWAETLKMEIPIYITMGKLPSQEKKTISFNGGFNVSTNNTFTFKPEIEIKALIQYAQLQEATLAINADIEFLQEVLIESTGAASIGAIVKSGVWPNQAASCF